MGGGLGFGQDRGSSFGPGVQSGRRGGVVSVGDRRPVLRGCAFIKFPSCQGVSGDAMKGRVSCVARVQIGLTL